MIEAVLFDWDGTLIDSKDAILASYRDASERVLGTPFPRAPADVARVLPMRAHESFGLLSDDPAVVETLVDEYHRAYLRHSRGLARAFPQATDTLRALRERAVRIGVVTSKGTARVEADIDRFGFHGLVDRYVTAEMSTERKPDPGPVLDGLRLLEVGVQAALYVGDGPQDVVAARRAGVRSVGALHGFHRSDEIRQERPDHTIESLGEIVPLVVELRAGSTAAGAHRPRP